MMRSIAISLVFFLPVSVNAADSSGTEPRAQGMISATLQVSDDLKTEVVDGPNSELPEDIVAKVMPALMKKARETHVATPAEDGVYGVAIDWKILNVNGQDQMKFAYRNSEAVPVRKVKPDYSQRNATTPVEIIYLVAVDREGSPTDISRDGGTPGNLDLYHAGREALKRWKFSPRYENGVAVASDVHVPLEFNNLSSFENQIDVPKGHGL